MSTAARFKPSMSHEEAVRIVHERETEAIALKRALADLPYAQQHVVGLLMREAAATRREREALGGSLRQFERRLERPLTTNERDAVIARFVHLGPVRLVDVMFDLDTAALGAWLADPLAR